MAEVLIGNVGYKPAVGMHHIQFSGEPTPAAIWAGTSWEIDTAMQGRVPIGSGGSYTFGATGGSADAVLVNHNHIINAALYAQSGGANYGITRAAVVDYKNVSRGYIDSSLAYSQNQGESGIGKNMMPYTVVNYWKRIA